MPIPPAEGNGRESDASAAGAGPSTGGYTERMEKGTVLCPKPMDSKSRNG